MRIAPIAALVLLAAARAAAQGFTLRFSGDIVVPPGTVHDGSAITMNGRIQVDGTLNGDAMTMNGDVAVTGTVRGSVRAFNGDITLTSTAVVEGDVWSANGRIDRQPGAQVRGRVQSSTAACVSVGVVLAPLAVVLALSIVGIPVVVFLPFAVMMLGLAGLSGASQLVGDRLLGGFPQHHA